jgi:hypothetical protein
MTGAQAIAFVERHGVVLESAHHDAIPSLAEAVAGERLRGSWWAHAKGRAIFRATRAVRASPDVLVCRLVADRISFAHARLWPALVRLSDRIPHERLDRVREVHSARGAHRVERTPFPRWVPAETVAAAKQLGERDARASLATVIDAIEAAG